MNPRPPFPFPFSSFRFSPLALLLRLLLPIFSPLYLAFRLARDWVPLLRSPFHSLLVAGSSLLASDRPWLWRPANPNPCLSNPMPLPGRSALACTIAHTCTLHVVRTPFANLEWSLIWSRFASFWGGFFSGCGGFVGCAKWWLSLSGSCVGVWIREPGDEGGRVLERIAVGWDVFSVSCV